MTKHLFDQAIALTPQADGTWLGRTSPAYANMVGPFGGLTAAQVLNGVLQHPQLLGEPIALTVNFAAALADGPFVVQARPARTNRSTQHWIIEMSQEGQTVITATAVTAARRKTWSLDDEPMPACPAPGDVPLPPYPGPIEFVNRYEMRPVMGCMPEVWDGTGDSSLSRLWVRDHPPRPLDFASLAAIADIFLPRVFIRRSTPVPRLFAMVFLTIPGNCGTKKVSFWRPRTKSSTTKSDTLRETPLSSAARSLNWKPTGPSCKKF